MLLNINEGNFPNCMLWVRPRVDARVYFDHYLLRHSTLREVIEVLQYTHVLGTRCLGQLLRKIEPECHEKPLA